MRRPFLRSLKILLACTLLFVAMSFILGGCGPATTESNQTDRNDTTTINSPDDTNMSITAGTLDAISAATMKRYRAGEMKEYQGVRLNPAIGPRDNSIKGVQQVDTNGFILTIDGLVDQPQSLSYEDILAKPSENRLTTLFCVEGWEATIYWQGVLLGDLIDLAGAQPTANTVIFHSVDGYTTSLSLQDIRDDRLILAYQANGLPLPAEMGYPFIFVAEEKWGYKWARWINRIELSGDSDFQGYWESAGYAVEGNLDEASR